MIPTLATFALAALALVCACAEQGSARAAPPEHEDGGPAPAAAHVVVLPPPAMSDSNFPCSDCHDASLPARTNKRPLKKAHQDITLAHGGDRLWCYDCHDSKDRDKLRLASGEAVAYEDAARLCGQCHGAEHRDWSAGAHGLRTGHWNGRIEALPCAKCHAAHAPRFPMLKPEPPPPRPVRTR